VIAKHADREAVSYFATTEGIEGEDVRDTMFAAVEQRVKPIDQLPTNDRLADRQRLLLHCRRNTQVVRDRFRGADAPVESSQSKGTAEAFVRSIEHDFAASILQTMRKASFDRCRNGSTTTTNFTRIARWVIVRRVS